MAQAGNRAVTSAVTVTEPAAAAYLLRRSYRRRHPIMWVVGEPLRLLLKRLQALPIGLVISASAVRNTSNC